MKKNLKIFNNHLNLHYKHIPLNIKLFDSRKIKYLPPISKEWKDNVYSFNKNKIKDIFVNNLNISKVIKAYFNLHFAHKLLSSKFVSIKRRRSFLRKIYISNAEIKHKYDKVIITLYTINPEKLIFYKRFLKGLNLLNKLNKLWTLLIIKDLKKWFLSKMHTTKKETFHALIIEYLTHRIRIIKGYLKYKKLWVIKKFIYSYNLNKFKFEKQHLLYKLSNILSIILNKKIEYNIVNLKSLAYNTDIFTDILTKKLKKKNIRLVNKMNSILNRVNLPKVNQIIERSRHISKIKDIDLWENKYKDTRLTSILNDDKIILSSDKEIENIFFNSINYKNMGGMRLEVKGRLTKRYRADRAVYKLKWKGGLKNIDSSFKGLSSVLFRGHFKPNVSYSISKSKRRVGSYAVKGWISGK